MLLPEVGVEELNVGNIAEELMNGASMMNKLVASKWTQSSKESNHHREHKQICPRFWLQIEDPMFWFVFGGEQKQVVNPCDKKC